MLAQGGMGTVWLARLGGKLGFERLVALKTILPIYGNDRQFCDMFLDEARIAALIDHENVARILEIGEDKGLLFYAMELIEGESLRKLYRDVRAQGEMLPMGVAMRIAADACAGLHATHELRAPDGAPLEVVHRDVSPQNLLITIRGTTKLIDFGVAKARARRSEETAAGTLKGKIEFMAPEQARGEALDRRADVYSVGAVLYELLAGRPVRDTEDGRQLAALHDVLSGVPVPPLPPYVPDIIRQIVERALAPEAAHRFATADELRRAIEQAMLATNLSASTDDVAKALEHFSRERTAKRRDVMDRALRAATEGRLAAATIVAPIGQVSVPQDPLSTPSMVSSSHRLGSNTGASIRTMGGASITAVPQNGTAGKVIAGVVALAIVAVLGVGAGMYVTKRGGLHVGKWSALTGTQAPPAAVPPPLASEGVPAASTGSSASTSEPTAVPSSPPTGIAATSPSSSTASRSASSTSTSASPSASAASQARTPVTQSPKGQPRNGSKAPDQPDDYGF